MEQIGQVTYQKCVPERNLGTNTNQQIIFLAQIGENPSPSWKNLERGYHDCSQYDNIP